jgi:transposase
MCPQSMSRVVRRLGFSRQKARPVHPQKKAKEAEAFQNVWPAPSASGFCALV